MFSLKKVYKCAYNTNYKTKKKKPVHSSLQKGTVYFKPRQHFYSLENMVVTICQVMHLFLTTNNVKLHSYGNTFSLNTPNW